MGRRKVDLRRGPLDMLILKTLSLESMHGIGIARRIGQITGGTLEPKPGSLFPALQRLQQKGLLRGEWGESENNRRAKYYQLTRAGRKQLADESENWDRLAAAVGRIMETAEI